MDEKYYRLYPTGTSDGKTQRYQIIALREFRVPIINRTIKEGDLGGWVECKDNLAQDGSWIEYGVCLMNSTKVSNSYIRRNLGTSNQSTKISNCIIDNSFCIIGNLFNAHIKNSIFITIYTKELEFLDIINSKIILKHHDISGTLDFYSNLVGLVYYENYHGKTLIESVENLNRSYEILKKESKNGLIVFVLLTPENINKIKIDYKIINAFRNNTLTLLFRIATILITGSEFPSPSSPIIIMANKIFKGTIPRGNGFNWEEINGLLDQFNRKKD